MSDHATNNRVRAALIEALAQVYDLPLSDTAADIVTEVVLDALSVTPEHYPGEPTPADMVRDLQEAVHGHSYATAHSPAEEWQMLLTEVRDSMRVLQGGNDG